ncbi:hypothetical protein D3C71_1234930 [compost metagenome]
MALIKCEECGHQVSRDAKACPSCGSTKYDASGDTKVKWVIIGIATVMIVIGVAQNDSKKREAEALTAEIESRKSAEQRAAEAAEKARKAADFQFAVSAAKAVKAAMKNPASFELVYAGLVDGGPLCLQYRGTNSFNAIVTQFTVIKRDGKIGKWDKDCANVAQRDMKSIRHAM